MHALSITYRFNRVNMSIIINMTAVPNAQYKICYATCLETQKTGISTVHCISLFPTNEIDKKTHQLLRGVLKTQSHSF